LKLGREKQNKIDFIYFLTCVFFLSLCFIDFPPWTTYLCFARWIKFQKKSAGGIKGVWQDFLYDCLVQAATYNTVSEIATEGIGITLWKLVNCEVWLRVTQRANYFYLVLCQDFFYLYREGPHPSSLISITGIIQIGNNYY
jgi:hypothetical protein